MLCKVLLVNETTGQRRHLKNWFYRYRDRLYPLGTPDRREAEKRAYHFGCLCRAIFEQQDNSFTDESPLPHQPVAEEDARC
jgi:hypothetical protein